MKTRLIRRASAGALALTLITATAAVADKIEGDADALATSAPAGNSVAASQPVGSTVAYDLSATIDETGNATDDVFPGTLAVSIARGGAWVAADAGSPASFTFTAYDTNAVGKVRITVPCEAEVGDVETMTVVLTAGASTNGKVLNPDSVTLTYEITATADTAGVCGVSNEPPMAGFTYSPANPDEGESVTFTDASTDSDGTIASRAWTFGDGQSSTDANPSHTYADNGTYEVCLAVTDDDGATDQQCQDVAVANVAPTISSASFGGTNLSCGTDNATLNVTFSDPGTNDTHTISVDWNSDGVADYTGAASSPASLTHTYGAGVHTASVTVTDDDGGVSVAATAQASVNYVMSGILQPINTTGSRSLFKFGSTIPVKVQILECDGTPALGQAPTLRVQKFVDGTPSGVDETVGSTSAADSGNLLRYTGDDGIYIYNLATKSLGDATAGYEATVTIPTTGQTAQATFGLKK